MDIFLFSVLNGLSYGMVLFLLAAGLSIVFGLMDIVNLAHGLMYMTGAYTGLIVAKVTGNYWLGLLAAILISGLLGLIVERGFLRTLYREQLAQILVCFGLIYIIVNLHQWIYGPYPRTAPELPGILSGAIIIANFNFTYYRIALILVGAIVCGFLYWAQERTKVGAIVRAGMNDPEHVKALGINLMSVNIGAFVLGSVLSGLGGYIGLPVIGAVVPTTASDVLFLGISIIIVGGVGSVQGALAGALLIGVGNSIIRCYFPEMAVFFIPIVLLLTLIFRPYGIFPRK
jgi:branched-chain amino acid transport system permease protein